MVDGPIANTGQLQQIITQLEARIDGLQSQLASIQASATPSRPVADSSIPTNLTVWDTWRPLSRTVLRLDADAIGGDEACFYWLYGNLESKVQAMVLPQLQLAEDTGNYNVDTIFDQLARF